MPALQQRYGGLLDRLQASLSSRRVNGKLRTLLDADDGLIDFASNDYLGLSRSSHLAKRIEAEYSEFLKTARPNTPLLGSTGSRLLTGNSDLLKGLETHIAGFHGFRHCLLANSGWDLNYGICSSVPSGDTVVLFDELSHNSLVMGLRASRGRQLVPFRHNSMDDLSSKMVGLGEDVEKLIVVETVYSMDGDVCPVDELLQIAEANDALVLVDEAHSFGILGAKGEGLVSSLGQQDSGSLLGVVFAYGKAGGYHGAALLTQHDCLPQSLLNYSRPLIYSTAMPIHSTFALRACYDEVAGASEGRERLRQLIEVFRLECDSRRLQVMDSSSPIQGVIVSGNDRVKQAVAELRRSGFNCLAIRAPTVPEGKERIRIILHAHNSLEEVVGLCQALEKVINR